MKSCATSAIGRPPTLSIEQKVAVRRLLSEGRSVASVAKDFATTRQTILRAKQSSQEE